MVSDPPVVPLAQWAMFLETATDLTVPLSASPASRVTATHKSFVSSHSNRVLSPESFSVMTWNVPLMVKKCPLKAASAGTTRKYMLKEAAVQVPSVVAGREAEPLSSTATSQWLAALSVGGPKTLM